MQHGPWTRALAERRWQCRALSHSVVTVSVITAHIAADLGGWRLLGDHRLSCVQFHFAPAVAEEPAPRVVRLIHRDAVNPGPQRTLSAKTANIAKYFQENFLNHVAGFGWIVEQARCQRVYRLLEDTGQSLVGPSRTGTQAFYKTEIVRRRALGRPVRR